ncbi:MULTISPECIES: hypothetical protein [unclassified Acinetobacter]|uniref:hypothetical protein n=1 Tax=Acinetobacter TaxID=469 RepID=UPI0018A9DAE7|nr:MULTISPECIES: hypothetical protein [unclassified Acinetobacter]MBJ9954794.1 hypothetical protein [Acinetobacter baumannii]
MQPVNNNRFIAHADAFSIGALILTRLRRVTGRVIDVMYLVDNKSYAQYVIDISLATQDVELNRHASRLQHLLDQEQPSSHTAVDGREQHSASEEGYVSGATEEEIYRAQVSHHYIGALR